MTRTRALLGALAAGSLAFGLATSAPAQTVNDISGTMAPVEGACLGLLALFSAQGCAYDGVDFTIFATTQGGPINNRGYYAPGNTPWELNGAPDISVVPAVGDGKVALAISGSVTIDDGADTTACTADDTLAGTIILAAGGTAASGGPGVRYEEYWGDGEVQYDLAAYTVDSAAANGGGGCDYEIASQGFPQLLTYSAGQGGGTYPLDVALVSDGSDYTALSPVGVACFEGDTDEGAENTIIPACTTPIQVGAPMTITTGGSFNCIDQNSAACPATAGMFAGSYSTLENTTWSISTDGSGNITAGVVHGTNQFASLNLPAWSAPVWSFTGTCTSGCGAAAGGTANDDSASTLQDTSVDIDILANDTGFVDDVTVAIDTDAANGTVTINGTNPGAQAGINVTYLPDVGFNGQDTFVYSVTDGSGSDTATVTVDVQADLLPVAPDGAIAVSSAGGATTAGTVDVSTLVGYAAGNTPSVVSISANADPATQGTCSVAGTTVSFTRVTDFVDGGATASCDYTITDNTDDTDTGTLTITITDVQPTLADGSGEGDQDTDIDASGAFTAGNGSVAQHDLSLTTDATNGSCALAVSGNNVVATFTPDAGYIGDDSCSATLADADGDAVEAVFSFTVNEVSNGGGNNGITLPGGKSALDLWSLGLLLGLPLLRRRRQN